MDCTVNAVRTHIEHFIGSNPLLASTSCTDPVNNLKHPPKKIRVKTPPLIVLNLTNDQDNQQQKPVIRSRSHSPFWVKDKTSSYSEVVKTGHVTKNNSRSSSPESIQGKERVSRKSNFEFLQKPSAKCRSKSPKDKWQQNYPKKCTLSFDSTTSSIMESSVKTDENLQTNSNLTIELDSKHVKRRSRSRKNRKAKNNFESESLVTTGKDVHKTEESTHSVDQSMDKTMSISPAIIVSDVKHQLPVKCDNVDFHYQKTPITVQETHTQTDALTDLPPDDSVQSSVASDATVPLNTITDSSLNPKLSLTSVSSIDYPDSCFDLNERLMGIFGSVDKKHHRQRVFDRPRSKSDTRNLNELSQIFTHNLNTDDKYTCRFERSAGSVKNNHPSRDSTSGRRSFDNILSPFGNLQMGMTAYRDDNNYTKSVRPRVEV